MKVELDKGDLLEAKLMLSGVKNAVPRITMRAINRSMTGVKTDMDKEVRKVLNLPKKIVMESIKIRKVSMQRQTGEVRSTGEPVELIYFSGTSQRAKGVSVKVKKKGKRSVIKHAFIATMKHKDPKKKGHTGVFWRERKTAGPKMPGVRYGVLPEKYKLPIHKLTGPRAQDILDDTPVMNAIYKSGGERLKKNFNQQLDYELSKL